MGCRGPLINHLIHQLYLSLMLVQVNHSQMVIILIANNLLFESYVVCILFVAALYGIVIEMIVHLQISGGVW